MGPRQTEGELLWPTMDLTQLANLGEFIGGTAVLVTLIYLAVQVRQTNHTVSTSAFHEITSHVLSLHAMLLGDRERCDVLIRGRGGLGDLEDADCLRFGFAASAVFHVTNDVYEYHRTGLMRQSQWDNWQSILTQNLASKGYREYWAENSVHYTTGFQALVSQVISKEHLVDADNKGGAS